MRKAHYKNEFSPAMLLKKGAKMEEDDEDEDNSWEVDRHQI